MSTHMPILGHPLAGLPKKSAIFSPIILSAGAVVVRVRKKRLGAGVDNNNTKMGCALTA